MGTLILFGLLAAMFLLSGVINILQMLAFIAMRSQAEANAADMRRANAFSMQLQKDLENASKPFLIRLTEEQVAGLGAMILRAIEKQRAEEEMLKDALIQ